MADRRGARKQPPLLIDEVIARLVANDRARLEKERIDLDQIAPHAANLPDLIEPPGLQQRPPDGDQVPAVERVAAHLAGGRADELRAQLSVHPRGRTAKADLDRFRDVPRRRVSLQARYPHDPRGHERGEKEHPDQRGGSAADTRPGQTSHPGPR